MNPVNGLPAAGVPVGVGTEVVGFVVVPPGGVVVPTGFEVVVIVAEPGLQKLSNTIVETDTSVLTSTESNTGLRRHKSNQQHKL